MTCTVLIWQLARQMISPGALLLIALLRLFTILNQTMAASYVTSAKSITAFIVEQNSIEGWPVQNLERLKTLENLTGSLSSSRREWSLSSVPSANSGSRRSTVATIWHAGVTTSFAMNAEASTGGVVVGTGMAVKMLKTVMTIEVISDQ